MKKKMRIKQRTKKLQTLGKVIISFGMIFFVWYQLKEISVKEIFTLVRWWGLALAFFVLVLRNFIGALRWKVLLGTYSDVNTTLLRLIKYYLIGNFFTLFLPTSVGGDIARIYYLNLETNRWKPSISSVLLERVTGMFSIALFIVIALLIGISDFVNTLSVWSLMILFFFVLGGSVWAFFTISWDWLYKVRIIPKSFTGKIIALLTSFRDYFQKPGHLSIAMVYSIIFQLTFIIYYYLMSVAIGEKVPFAYFLLLIPIVWIISLLPVSLGGLGVREGSYVALFALVGMSNQSSSIISTINLLLLIVQGLFGGGVFLLQGTKLEEIKKLNVWSSKDERE